MGDASGVAAVNDRTGGISRFTGWSGLPSVLLGGKGARMDASRGGGREDDLRVCVWGGDAGDFLPRREGVG